MPRPVVSDTSVSKDTLRKFISYNKQNVSKQKQVELAQLRLRYQELHQPLTNYIRPLLTATDERIHPKMLPTQASGRWSTFNPPLTNFSKKCINPDCPQQWHEKRPECWSVRDCIMPDQGWFWVDLDLDAVEARIFALKVYDQEAIHAFNRGLDIHTPTACRLFDLPQPGNLVDPHVSPVDTRWRQEVKWRGKDDLRRGIAKNFRYGTQYCLKPEAVLLVKDLEQFGLDRSDILRLAYAYWELTKEQQKIKFEHMKRIRTNKVARTLFGSRRVFFDNSDDTAKEGFNHECQGSVVDYINMTLLKIHRGFPGSYLVHNAHDGFKWSFPLDQYDPQATFQQVKEITEGCLTYQGLTVNITASGKIIMPQQQAEQAEGPVVQIT